MQHGWQIQNDLLIVKETPPCMPWLNNTLHVFFFFKKIKYGVQHNTVEGQTKPPFLIAVIRWYFIELTVVSLKTHQDEKTDDFSGHLKS